MKRGDVVTVAISGDDGKPRPAVVVQTDVLNVTDVSVVVCLVTSALVDAPLLRLGARIGKLDDETMLALSRSLAFVIGLG